LIAAAFVILQAGVPAPAQERAAGDLTRQIDSLSAFDYAIRTNAARAVRRTPAAEAVPALSQAARSHTDQFVRYRALVLVTAFRAPGTPGLMQALIGDRNDRIREVVYRWYEQNPEAGSIPALLAALQTEQAEFVRPALVRALAARGDNATVQRALLQEAGRGLDFFRIAVIQTLGEHRAAYAVKTIAQMAELDGPIQDDAILALGRIGDRGVLPALVALTKLSLDTAPSLEAALCLLGDRCDERIAWLAQTAQSQTRAEVARAAVIALGTVAAEEHPAALTALFDLERSTSRLRGDLALAFSAMALRRPESVIGWLVQAPDELRGRAVDLLREGFESLEEDFAEEQLFAAARASYWSAAEGSATRNLTASLIDRLEF
jgi:hypothetical protein